MAPAKMGVAGLEQFLRAEFPQAFGKGDITIERADGEIIKIAFSDIMEVIDHNPSASAATP